MKIWGQNLLKKLSFFLCFSLGPISMFWQYINNNRYTLCFFVTSLFVTSLINTKQTPSKWRLSCFRLNRFLSKFINVWFKPCYGHSRVAAQSQDEMKNAFLTLLDHILGHSVHLFNVCQKHNKSYISLCSHIKLYHFLSALNKICGIIT